jgi:Alpha/beta hydrolase of unknown function (DUF900)
MLPFALENKSTGGLCGYILKSTAPSEVDKATEDVPALETQTREVLQTIATHLLTQRDPQIVLFVHGFNNPPKVAAQLFERLFSCTQQALSPEDAERTVLIGYQWPSEGILKASIKGIPRGLWGTLAVGVLLWALGGYLLAREVQSASTWVQFLVPTTLHTFGWIGLILGGFLVPLALLFMVMRASTYWRDNYRATQYGVPDLVVFFQQLDKILNGPRLKSRVNVSFVGHSMGGYVVTSVVRILSDVFDAGNKIERANNAVGNTMAFDRLVLISPDIPAEALFPRRANFLHSSLRRFNDAFLFSNEADVVLWTVSTIANSFSFPAGLPDSGYRLGNIAVKGNGEMGGVFSQLRLGNKTLASILDEARIIMPPQKNQKEGMALEERFTYIDATNFHEEDKQSQKMRYYLSRGRKSNQIFGPLRQLKHLFFYAISMITGQKHGCDVHSGYFFEHQLLEQIVKVACLGYDKTTLGDAEFCENVGLRVRRGTPLRGDN